MTMGPLTTVAMDAGGAMIGLGVAKAATDMIQPRQSTNLAQPKRRQARAKMGASESHNGGETLMMTVRKGDSVTIIKGGKKEIGRAVVLSAGKWIIETPSGKYRLANAGNIARVAPSSVRKAMELNRLQSRQGRPGGALVKEGARERPGRRIAPPSDNRTAPPHHARRGSGRTRRPDR